jgi:hypothetical protein
MTPTTSKLGADMTVEQLKAVLRYDPETGVFTWIAGHRAGTTAGRGGKRGYKGYLRIYIRGKDRAAHRLAWLYMTGEWPKEHIDHINGIRDDNRFANLREANCSENGQNFKRPAHNRSGYIGVHFLRASNRWVSKIRINKVQVYLGSFKSPEEAMKAYLEAKAKYHHFQPVPRELQGESK